MTPTDALRTRLRKLLDERIPEGGSTASTRFTDNDLDELLLESSSIFGAASMGWTMKAGMMQSEMGDIEQITAGQETERLVSLKERLGYALTMAENYKVLARSQGSGSLMLGIRQPEVL